MRKLASLFIVAVLFFACKTESKTDVQKEVKKVEKFPEVLEKVFEKHGGIDTWRKAKTLSFNKGEEAHTIDLQSRRTVIQSPKYSLGYDGKEVWISEKDSGTFKSTPAFYYNLHFYFYAMPFVLADDGIIYEDAEAITFEGKEYPGIKISYEANIGTSPDDNYIIYYDAETYQMQWLAYTVTFRSKKPSDRYNLLRYKEWETVNGLVLPKMINWYKKDENGQPIEPQGTPTNYTLPLVSKDPVSGSFYEKPTE
jgi:hypothetical protein